MDFNAFGSKPRGFQQIVDLSAAVHLPSPPAGATTALIVAETQDVRWRDDGVAPTATVGMLLQKGVEFQYQGDLSAIQFIQTTASAVLNVSFYSATGGILTP